MELFWWAVTLILMAVGLIGTVLPIFPGTAVILGAAILHRIMLGPEKSIGWLSIALLVEDEVVFGAVLPNSGEDGVSLRRSVQSAPNSRAVATWE